MIIETMPVKDSIISDILHEALKDAREVMNEDGDFEREFGDTVLTGLEVAAEDGFEEAQILLKVVKRTTADWGWLLERQRDGSWRPATLNELEEYFSLTLKEKFSTRLELRQMDAAGVMMLPRNEIGRIRWKAPGMPDIHQQTRRAVREHRNKADFKRLRELLS